MKCDIYHSPNISPRVRFKYKYSVTLEGVELAKNKHSAEPNLKGTLVSVFGVGIIIILMWFATYFLYVAR